MSFSKKLMSVNSDEFFWRGNEQNNSKSVRHHVFSPIHTAILTSNTCLAIGLETHCAEYDNIEVIRTDKDINSSMCYWGKQDLCNWPRLLLMSTFIQSSKTDSVVRWFKQMNPALQIIVLHDRADEDIYHWFQCGAKAYLNLRCSSFDLKLAIETACFSEYYFLRTADAEWDIYSSMLALERALE